MASSIMKRYNALAEQAENLIRERGEAEKIRIQVGSATCENAAGSDEVLREFRKHIESSGRKDIALRIAGCTGRCSCEPVVNVLRPGEFPVKYERVDRELAHEIFTSHVLGGKPLTSQMLDNAEGVQHELEFMFCLSARCRKAMPENLPQNFKEKLEQAGIDTARVMVSSAGCFGLCGGETNNKAVNVLVRPDNVIYRIANNKDIDEIIESHVKAGRIAERLLVKNRTISKRFFSLYGDVAFFNRQSRVALRNSGIINPDRIEEYVHYEGFRALASVLERNDPNWIIDQLLESKLRGRGGAGYPTGTKWKMAAGMNDSVKYIICNADEGDPGAFMDRSMLEGDPFSVVEGMMIGGFAIGASKGFFYIRAEYPMAIRRMQNAIDRCREHGLLGENILGSGFNFDIEIRLGAGAFVCGEETALIHSIEGDRGEPRIRPPYPTTSGLWGHPTVINNVETYANIPAIFQYGPKWFASIGTEKSGGTKVFALAGKVEHTGLVEVPMGTTLRDIVCDIGGGVPNGKKLKAIQTGGPAGGCIPDKWLDTPVDFDTLTKVGAIMGSGGMIVMDEDDCMVDIARYFLSFSQDESCGKCTPCREGSKRMLEIIERITSGKGELDDLAKLERLARLMNKGALCGLGRNASNPVLSTLKHFRDEYTAHVVDKRCPAKKCTALLRYVINAEKCVGCTACARNCPVSCIAGEARKPHVIDESRCIKCGRCFAVCKFAAVEKI